MYFEKMTDDEILEQYGENRKSLELETTPKFLDQTNFAGRLPGGHEALQGYMIGQSDYSNELIGILKKYPNIQEEFKKELFDLIRRRDKFSSDMFDRWDDEHGGYQGVSIDQLDMD